MLWKLIRDLDLASMYMCAVLDVKKEQGIRKLYFGYNLKPQTCENKLHWENLLKSPRDCWIFLCYRLFVCFETTLMRIKGLRYTYTLSLTDLNS